MQIARRKDPLFQRGRVRIDINGGGATIYQMKIKAQ